jgi:hypothetical protein
LLQANIFGMKNGVTTVSSAIKQSTKCASAA